MKHLLRYLAFVLMVGSICAQVKPIGQDREVVVGSISRNGDIVVYQINVADQWASGYRYSRYVKGDCRNFKRLEIISDEDWKSNELYTAYRNTKTGEELAFACSYKESALSNNINITPEKPPNNPDTSTTNINQGKRVALVVGNANYKTRPLKNPRNDADDVSNALKASGFQVIDLRDATLQQMRNGVRQFGDRLINNDVGLVYYSGHGVEVKGRNYFIPVNADIMREDEIADQGLDVSLILEKMNTAGKGVNILIVDACRDDPFGRSFRSASRGLAQMDAPRGTIIAYATSPGKVASDGDGRNSPYTKNLVKAMQQPNKPIEQVFKEVRRAVQEETKNQQTPWENTSLSGDFYFKVAK
jgi:Caspase domain